MPEKSRKTIAGSEPKRGDFLNKLYGSLPSKEIFLRSQYGDHKSLKSL